MPTFPSSTGIPFCLALGNCCRCLLVWISISPLCPDRTVSWCLLSSLALILFLSFSSVFPGPWLVGCDRNIPFRVECPTLLHPAHCLMWISLLVPIYCRSFSDNVRAIGLLVQQNVVRSHFISVPLLEEQCLSFPEFHGGSAWVLGNPSSFRHRFCLMEWTLGADQIVVGYSYNICAIFASVTCGSGFRCLATVD